MSASQLPTARVWPRTRAQFSTQGRAVAQPSSRALGVEGQSVVLGRYRLLRRLGAGGFGTVWMAHDERLDREVAVKVVARERVVGGRLEREARAAARLSHPGIVMLYEAAVDDEAAYLVSELVRGPTLADLLDAGRLSDRDIVEIAVALCDALAYAHSQGIVHRDVKPSNVLVPERPATRAGIAKLTDFGVARVIGGDSLTRTGDVVGTDAYMSPEQAEGREAGAPADLYALALVSYEALTGVNPIRTTTAAQRARRLGAHLPPLRRQRRELPRELGRAIDLALRPKPRERGTLEELRVALIASHALVADTPGVVTGPLRSVNSVTGPLRSVNPEPEPFEAEQLAQRSRHRSDHGSEEPEAARTGVPTSARALAALASAGTVGWVTASALAPGSIAPAAAGTFAAVLVAVLPRIGWLTAALALGGVASIQGRPGVALLVGLATIALVPLLPRGGASWPLPAGAVVLGVLGLAGAWPAVAARLGGPWRRAVLGAAGWLWLVLAAPIHGDGLYLAVPRATPTVGRWSSSLSGTIDLVLRPLVSSGTLMAAPVWALAALVLPWIVRGRSPAVAIVLVTAWAAALVSATISAVQLVHPGDLALATGTAVLGAIAGGLVALAPVLARATRARA